MGLRDIARRLRTSVEDLHDERLHDRFAGFDVTPLSDLQCRVRCRVGGEISRIRLTPRSGVPALEIEISDGTGEAVAVFTGRRTIPGIEHGRALLLEGVAHADRGKRVFLNPAYTLL
jgi:hypothetical protein